MALYYNYSGSTVPPDPTISEPGTLYTEPVAYVAGYYKAARIEGSDISDVARASFGVAPSDYIHYYPLVADFADAAGSNNLLNSGCSISSNGCTVDNTTDYADFASSIGFPAVSLFMTFTVASTIGAGNITQTAGGYCPLRISSTNYLSAYYGSELNSTKLLQVNTTYKICSVQSGTSLKIYCDGNLVLTTTGTDCNTDKLFRLFNYTSPAYAALGIYKDIMIFDRELTEEEIGLL